MTLFIQCRVFGLLCWVVTSSVCVLGSCAVLCVYVSGDWVNPTLCEDNSCWSIRLESCKNKLLEFAFLLNLTDLPLLWLWLPPFLG